MRIVREDWGGARVLTPRWLIAVLADLGADDLARLDTERKVVRAITHFDCL